MKIVIEEPRDDEEEQIIVRCRQMTPDLLRMLALLKAQDALVAYDGAEIHRVQTADVYYIEVVDNKTFLYYKDKVYESKQKLYELEEALSNSDFLRVSKSVILNLRKVRTLSPALSGRFETTLDNGEKVIISRQYIGDLKKRLGI
ncbi:MAG: LytTR family transcriptional regulator [Oscillospiraceae bacterium]|nr:LytTR family transcriptional regulator [Oscillospiraceae bacterium]